MAEIKEVVKDTTNKIKKKFKEKPVFYTALGVVVVFALYKLFSTEEEVYEEGETVTTAYVPTGYDGYPTMSDSMMEDYENFLSGDYSGIGGGYFTDTGSSGSTVGGVAGESTTTETVVDPYYEDQYNNLMSEYSLLMNKLDDAYAEADEANAELTYINEMLFPSDGVYKVLNDGSALAEAQDAIIRADNLEFRNAVVAEMKANSEAYNNATTTAEKQRLHEQNQALAKYVGGTFDSGYWYNPDGSLLYNVDQKTTNNGNDIQSSTVAKMQANSEAYGKATTTAEKQRLYEENQRLGKSIGATYNASNGKWYTDTGSELLDYTKKSSSSSKSSTSSYGGVSYDKNTDYAQKIKDAKKSGASQSTINKLTAQRNAKIKGENLNSDGSKKK